LLPHFSHRWRGFYRWPCCCNHNWII